MEILCISVMKNLSVHGQRLVDCPKMNHMLQIVLDWFVNLSDLAEVSRLFSKIA